MPGVVKTTDKEILDAIAKSSESKERQDAIQAALVPAPWQKPAVMVKLRG